MSVMARTGRPTTVDFSIEPEPFGTGGFQYVTAEDFIEGTFRKYINNNGSICESVNADSLIKKAVSGKLLI
ncbi:unnamed protein product [Pocillopora meandrina]|uniref:Uncharacterized protein n=1 Tax=Pocillopora meandrina TaxID=46732 RepID=A0AAU9XDL9_9CNID|nr:unnamed protein product [Pocillopora meandrina]